MRIGLVVPGFSANSTDWCIPALRDLVAELARTDDVRVLAFRYPAPERCYTVFGAKVIAIGGGTRRGTGSVDVWGRALRVLIAEHRRRPFDVLHAFWASETGAVTVVAGRLLGVPTVVSLAGGELVALRDIKYGGQLTLGERLKVTISLGLASAVSGGSDYELALAGPWLRSRSTAEIRRLPLGVDLHRFAPRGAMHVPAASHGHQYPVDGTRGNEPKLVHAASLVAVKDQASLLRAAAVLAHRGIRFSLDVVGDGPLLSELSDLADRLGIGAQVRFRGEVAHDQLAEIYRSASAFVLSSRHEAQCMAALEAAASGVPVVGTRVGIVPELAPSAALVVPVGDSKRLAGAVVEILSDPLRRAAMGQAARACVERDFGLDTSVERFREAYGAL